MNDLILLQIDRSGP